jgi:hypothetical protein
MVAMRIRRGSRRIVYIGHLQLMALAIAQRDRLAAENARLKREQDELRLRIAAERAAHDEFRDAVAARQEAEAQLVAFYREGAECVRRGETPPRRWLH